MRCQVIEDYLYKNPRIRAALLTIDKRMMCAMPGVRIIAGRGFMLNKNGRHRMAACIIPVEAVAGCLHATAVVYEHHNAAGRNQKDSQHKENQNTPYRLHTEF